MKTIKCFAAAAVLLMSVTVNAQTNLDSLSAVWQDESQADSIRGKAYNEFIWKGYLFSQPDSAFILADALVAFALEKGLPKLQGAGYSVQGISMDIRGDYPQALKYFQRCLTVAEEIGNKVSAAGAYSNIGNIYMRQEDWTKALEYYQRGLEVFEEIEDESRIAAIADNIGSVYFQLDDPLALKYQNRALEIREKIGDKRGLAVSLSNVGVTYGEMGEYAKALDHHERSLKISEELGDESGLARSNRSIGLMNWKLGSHELALSFCQRSLELSKKIGSLDYEQVACECLYETYKGMGKSNEALKYHELMTALNDSLFNDENTKKLTQLEMQYAFDKKEAKAQAAQEKKDALAAQELRRQKLVRNGFIGGFAVVFLFAGVFFFQRNRIGKEKKRSEELLLNILPEEVAEELKDKGEAEAQLIDQVTVLFTDFKGFTAMSEQLSPKELVKDLNECFSEFDLITAKYGIEKIKTIGDAYMAAGGLPTPNITHATDVINAAIEMRDFVEAGKAKKIEHGLPYFEIRIGIHTGPVVAGIVGVKKFQYDIWGDTVNTASRMESSGEVGQVNISEATYELVKEHSKFDFTSRGKVEAKGKGELEMYFVETT